jgi:DNA-binding Lrp family transcriptional regulator
MQDALPITNSSFNTSTSGIDDLFDGQTLPDTIRTLTKNQEMSVSDAAIFLGVTERTIWRRIKKGQLDSRIEGTRALVSVPAKQPVTATLTRHYSESDLEQLRKELAKVRTELESATFRNTYMQGQLDLYETQFKLLTDSQHKPKWWHRFSEWFLSPRVR